MRSWDDELRTTPCTIVQVFHDWYIGIQHALQNQAQGSCPEFIKPRLRAQEAWVQEWIRMMTRSYDTVEDRSARAIAVIMMECYAIELGAKNLNFPFVSAKLRFNLTRELDTEAAAERMQRTDSELFMRLAKQIDYPEHGYLKIMSPALHLREALIIQLNQLYPLHPSADEDISDEDYARIMAQLETGGNPYE